MDEERKYIILKILKKKEKKHKFNNNAEIKSSALMFKKLKNEHKI